MKPMLAAAGAELHQFEPTARRAPVPPGTVVATTAFLAGQHDLRGISLLLFDDESPRTRRGDRRP
jgi:hypothetical protein